MTEKDSASGAISNFTLTDFAKTRNSILLTKLPMPPTSNTQYTLVRRGPKTYHVASEGLKEYKRQMNLYRFSCRDILGFKNKVLLWRTECLPLEIRAVLFFHKDKIFTKKGYPRKMDVSNRLKALHDSVAEMLGIDDSIFFRVYAEKAECHDNLNEGVCVEILPII